MKRQRSDAGLVACPVCGKQVPFVTINLHMDSSCVAASMKGSCKRQKRHAGEETDKQHCETASAPRRMQSILPLGDVAIEAKACNASAREICEDRSVSPDSLGHITQKEVQASDSKAQIPLSDRSERLAIPSSSVKPSCANGESCSPELREKRPAWSILMQSAAQKLPGHHLFDKFISDDEEQELIDFIETCEPPWNQSTFNGPHRGKRWGVLMDLQKRTVSPATHGMPDMLMRLAEKMRLLEPLADFYPTEANANSYNPGKGDYLGPHVDDRQLSTGAIVTLSLMSSCVMTFKREKQSMGKTKVRIHLSPGSLSVLTRDSRYAFTHEVEKEDFHGQRRISVTFRQSALKT